jgi:hypothetical protein
VWLITLDVFGEGGILVARKTRSQIFVVFFHFTAFKSDACLAFSKSTFTPSGKNRENLNISFMNDIYILYDDKDKIEAKSSAAEL